MGIIATGLLSIILVLFVSASIIAGTTVATSTDFFMNWVGAFFLCATPFQIMLAIVWQQKIPYFDKELSQPLQGIVLTGLVMLAGALILTILFHTVGHGVMSPVLIHYAIQSVGVALLVIIVFGCWPINKLTDSQLMQGVGVLIYVYLLNFVLFKVFYDYSFLAGAPFYSEVLNPGGFFNGVTALTFAVTFVSFILVLTLFDMWPIAQFVKNDSQPLFGLIATAWVLLTSAFVYYLFVHVIGMEQMDFMTRGPVCIIFGAFLVDNMMQFQLFTNLAQPLKGLVKSAICLFGAFAMYRLYELVLPLFVGDSLPAGPEAGYAMEVWIGTAMLGVTFPVINMVTGAFNFWPILRGSAT